MSSLRVDGVTREMVQEQLRKEGKDTYRERFQEVEATPGAERPLEMGGKLLQHFQVLKD